MIESQNLSLQRCFLAAGAVAALVLAGCDRDPSTSVEALRRLDCVTTRVSVQGPISVGFSGRISPSSVAPGNVVVANALTGVEIGGSLSTNADRGGDSIVFTPSAPFPFDTPIRVRVQNILSATGTAVAPVSVCDVRTIFPPIRELFWTALPPLPGSFVGISAVSPIVAFVASVEGPVYRTAASGFTTVLNSPYLTSGRDVGFADTQRGFAIQFEGRTVRSLLVQSLDGGVTYDTVLVTPGRVIDRVIALPVAGGGLFAMAGGGQTAGLTEFYKYRPATNTFTTQSFQPPGALTSTGQVRDISILPTDTANGAAVTFGIRAGAINTRGLLFVTSNGGATWDSVPGSRASDATVNYSGVAIRSSGAEVFVAGSGGTLRRFNRTGPLAYTITEYPLSAFGITNPDPANPDALIFTDVEFSPADQQKGWLIGARQEGVVNGAPRYTGLIFETRDGGRTWTRQGVKDAVNFGAEFPRLNRISVLPALVGGKTIAFIAGQDGAVLRYEP